MAAYVRTVKTASGARAAQIVHSSRRASRDALGRVYEVLGFETATGGDEVFRALVLARIIEPTGKLDSLRVIDEAGTGPPS